MAEYAKLKTSIANLKNAAYNISEALKGELPWNDEWLDWVKEALENFGVYPEISSLKEYQLIQEVLPEAKKPKSFFQAIGLSKAHKKEVGKAVLQNYERIITEASTIAQSLKPPIKIENREGIIGVLKELGEYEEKYREDVKEFKPESILLQESEAWEKVHAPFAQSLEKILEELKALAPYIQVDEHCFDAESCFRWIKRDITPESKLRKLREAQVKLYALVSIVKRDFNITRSDLEKPSLPLLLPEKVIAMPKYEKEIEELKELNVQLTSQLGLNELVRNVRETFIKMERNVEKIVLTDLVEKKVGEEDRKFLDSTYRIKGKLMEMAGDEHLSEIDKSILRKYSDDLKLFIDRKKA